MSAPWAHQIEDTATLIREPKYFLGLGPGLGKSRIVIDAAHRLWLAGEIDALVVVCPAQVKSVWADPDPVLGEVAKWAGSLPYTLEVYGPKTDLRRLRSAQFPVLVTNPEFIRREERLRPLVEWAAARQTFLVADESWQYQNPSAKQTKAVRKLRQACCRVVLLNGTPGEPRHQFSQFQILDSEILKCRSFKAFRDAFCVMGGWMGKEITGYQNLDVFRQWTAPYITVRDAKDCLDLPPVVRTQIEVPLTPATWKVYCQMRDDTVAWLSSTEASSAGQAGVKALRLAQVVNGFLGGVEDAESPSGHVTKEIGREKLEALIDYLDAAMPEKAVVFTRFQKDVERTAHWLGNFCPYEVGRLYGGSDKTEQHVVKTALAPGPSVGRFIGVVNTVSGGAGLNFAAAQLGIFLGHDYSLRVRQQAEKRLDRPGQTGRVTFVDVLATGPNGEKTIDHVIVAAHRRQEELSVWTPEAWRNALTGETDVEASDEHVSAVAG